MEDFDSIVLPPHGNPIVIEWLKQGKLKIMPSGCWEWQKSKLVKRGGYGQINIRGRILKTHRIAISAEAGDLFVIHSCDNPPCCNPFHLKLGTPEDNSQDMKKKGRALRIGASPRCSCGLAMTSQANDCQECRSKRLGKFCHCGKPVSCKGLCGTHYQRNKKARK